ncbi:LOW QUALITY PROTEIN: hypothetical protein PHMEG_00028100 [Phytophthora megakarya]|uniref:Integrase catalytic domain-containing protein n=1 Tax=Phytophthora megakarya TaxID=4795 RepID=A0A225V5Q2_9STRA|nr:LOW QUALITY PROTEIN: hypothetical protein PHMEG_00028100 [Phytophthora megakarya]
MCSHQSSSSLLSPAAISASISCITEMSDYSHELAFLPDLTEPSSTVLDYTGSNVVNIDRHGGVLMVCLLDAASGFWAVMMTERARKVSAFVCALGHFEWRRMPFGLQNAPMIYQRMMDNALWGFVQPKGGWKEYSERMRFAEEDVERTKTGVTESSTRPRSKFEADRKSASNPDHVSELLNSSIGDMFMNGESDESLLSTEGRFVDDICFGSETFEGCLSTLDRLLRRFTECRISVSFTKNILVQPRVDFLSHEVVPEGLRADAKKIKRVIEFSFPTSKKGMQSFLGALYYYSRFIQDFALKEEDCEPGDGLSVARQSFARLQQKIGDAPILRHFDRQKEIQVILFANEWALSSTLMQELALLLLLKTYYTQLAGRTIHEWVHTSKSLFGRTTQFAVMLSQWHLVVTRVKEKDYSFAQLARAGQTSFVDLENSLATVTPPMRGSSTVRMDPQLLYARLPRSYSGLVVSFDGSAKTEKYGGYGSCSCIIWRLPGWTIVTAASTYLEAATVNLVEYSGMNNGVQAALDIGATDLVIVGDSRLAIQQSLGVIVGKKESLMTQLNRHRERVARLKSVKYLHAVREYNASAESLATEALENKASNVISDEPGLAELRSLNRIQEVIYAPITESSADEPSHRTSASSDATFATHGTVMAIRNRPGAASKKFFDFVRKDIGDQTVTVKTRLQARSKPKRVRFADETSVTGGEDVHNERKPTRSKENVEEGSRLTVGESKDSSPRRRINPNRETRGKISYHFVIREDNVLYYVGTKPLRRDQQQEDAMLRLVVPSTMIQEVLQNCHDSLEGGHQGIARTFYRVKLDYYWIGLFADVARHVRSCPDCSSSKSRPKIRGYSPGNILAERPFQVVSMDFVIPLPKSRRGNTALILFQCAFTGYVMGKAMADTTALRVAQTVEEFVYRRFSVPSLIRHDRDPRFMSEVFQSFAEMMQSRSRATLSYWPQADGQQERSVKTVL